MRKLLNRLVGEDDGHSTAVYALWVSVVTAIIEPHLVLGVVYQLADLFLLFTSQLRALTS